MDVEGWVKTFLSLEDGNRQRHALEQLFQHSASACKYGREILFQSGENALLSRDGTEEFGGKNNRARAPSIVPMVDFLECLPGFITVTILKFLDLRALAMSSCVSQRWRKKCTSDAVDDVWQSEFLRLHRDSTYIENVKILRAMTWRALCHLQGMSRLGWYHGKVEKYVYTGHKDRVRHVRIRANTFVSASWDRSLRVVHLNEDGVGGHSKQIASHGGSVFGVWFDGQVAVTCSEDSTIKIWDVFKETCVVELIGHETAVYRVAMISREILVSCSRDFVGVWHWPSGRLLHRLLGHSHDVHRIQVSDNVIVTGSYDCTIRVWSYPSCEPLWVSPACHKSGVSSLHFQDGNVLATGGAKGGVYVWDLTTGMRKHACDGSHHNFSTISCILVADDRVFSTSSLSLRQSDGIVCIWDIDTGTLLQKLIEPFHINTLKADFGLIFCACSDGKLRLRAPKKPDFSVIRELTHGEKPLYDVDVQGPRAVTCGLDKNVVLWSLVLHDI